MRFLSHFWKKPEISLLFLEKTFISFWSTKENKVIFFHKGELLPGFFHKEDLQAALSTLNFKSPLLVLLPSPYFKVFLLTFELESIPKREALSKRKAKEKEKEVLRRAVNVVKEELSKREGILAREIDIVSVSLLWQVADGYNMVSLEGIWGEKIEVGVKVVVNFKENNTMMAQVLKSIFRNRDYKVAHPLEYLLCYKVEGPLILLGHELSYLLERNEVGLERKALEVPWGTERIFITLARELGWARKEAEHYLSAWQKGEVSEALANKIGEILKEEIKNSPLWNYKGASIIWGGEEQVLRLQERLGLGEIKLFPFRDDLTLLCLWDSLKKEGR